MLNRRLSNEEKKIYIENLIDRKEIEDEDLINQLPKKIYKYRSLENEYEYENLKNDQLWMARPDTFNDPYDTRIRWDLNKIIDKYLAQEKLSKYWREASKSLLKRKGDESVTKELENFRRQLGILCFSEDRDNLLTWAHYADYYKGICVEYEYEQIQNKYKNDFFPVIYERDLKSIDEFIKIKSNNNISLDCEGIMLYSNKAIDWEYEREWRVCLILSDKEREQKGKLISVPKPTAIYVGCNIEESKFQEVKKIAREKKVSLYRMFLSDDQYKLEWKKVKD